MIVFYRGMTVRVGTFTVINPAGQVLPPESTVVPGAMVVTNAPFTNEITELAQDPLTVTLMVRCTGKQKIEYDYPSAPIVRQSTGMYFADLQTDIGGTPGLGSGLWTVEWAGTGGVAAIASMQFMVIDPPIIPSWL